MRSQTIYVVFGLVFYLSVVARADKITSDYDHAVNFSKYHTFMWIHAPESKEPFLKERIITAVNAQLVSRGLRQVSNGADLAISANFATGERRISETLFSDWGGWMGPFIKTYEEGTLSVDLFDAQDRKLVWQGTGTDAVSPKPEKRTKGTDRQIEKMFKQFPGATEQ